MVALFAFLPFLFFYITPYFIYKSLILIGGFSALRFFKIKLRRVSFILLFFLSLVVVYGSMIEMVRYNTDLLQVVNNFLVCGLVILLSIYIVKKGYSKEIPLCIAHNIVQVILLVAGIFSFFFPIAEILGQEWKPYGGGVFRATSIFPESGMYAVTSYALFFVYRALFPTVSTIARGKLLLAYLLVGTNLLLSVSGIGLLLFSFLVVSLYSEVRYKSIRLLFILLGAVLLGAMLYGAGIGDRFSGEDFFYSSFQGDIPPGPSASIALKISNVNCVFKGEWWLGKGIGENSRLTFDSVLADGRANIMDGCAFVNSNGMPLLFLLHYGLLGFVLCLLAGLSFVKSGGSISLVLGFLATRLGDSSLTFLVFSILFTRLSIRKSAKESK
ncbi:MULTISPECIES: hypothetical protein [Halomonas]|uniref:hypothetical protein n=1 Tax=Halomonas TaxID=2745 RepID=UPI0011B1EB5D|nr:MULTISPECIES: hypothetical protein [Halomonas]